MISLMITCSGGLVVNVGVNVTVNPTVNPTVGVMVSSTAIVGATVKVDNRVGVIVSVGVELPYAKPGVPKSL